LTYTEVCTVVSLSDLMKANALLDMKNDLEKEAYGKK
jgi:hypothetical protein